MSRLIITDSWGYEQPSTLDTLKGKFYEAQREALKAKYDAAQNHIGNENHWIQTDFLSPNAANSHAVRKKLRARSRYEMIENNPYLKGIVLSIANDFVGRGPRLQITDRRIAKERREFISELYNKRAKKIRLREKLFQWKMAKPTDGESFGFAFSNPKIDHPVNLDWYVLEADQCASYYGYGSAEGRQPREIDGIRFDQYNQPESYHILDEHPGETSFFNLFPITEGEWVDAKFVIHWFRRDRPWLRGIPEITPSLPLCAILRRYTLAVVKAAEFAADIAGVLETQGPPSQQFWNDFEDLGAATGGDTFPTEHGMFVTTPWGYQLKQFDAKQPMAVYDSFVQSILTEIIRPLLVPLNRGMGTSKDSNMASAVVDEWMYKEGLKSERASAEENILEKDVDLWWAEAVITRDYLDEPLILIDQGENGEETRQIMDEWDATLAEFPFLRTSPPEHRWRWDQIGMEHTDPQKVETAWSRAWEYGFVSDRDIQEQRYNRDVDEHYENLASQNTMRREMDMPIPIDRVVYRDPNAGAGQGAPGQNQEEEDQDQE